MTSGFKDVNGFVWPECDTEAARVVCSQVLDVEIALQHCRRFKICVQAGGNMGVWPKYLSRVFSQVYTFEPEPLNYQALMYNCPEPNIVKHQAALGNSFVAHGVHMTYPEGRGNMGACAVGIGGDIPMMTIDSLVLPACDLIQLDIEGFEPHAIIGAQETIFRHKPVLMLEDKGLSKQYGWEKGWWESSLLPLKEFGYRLVETINRDIILIPTVGS